MKGYSELKMLAEYATPGPWVAQHPNAGQRGSEVASGGGLNQVCADLGPSNALYIAASNPSAVLELIAEVERLSFREKMLSEYGCEYCAGSGHVHRIDGDYLGVCDRCSAYEFNCAKHEIEKLKNENESLKKDAARYRWLRDSSNFGKKSDPMVISGYPDDISMLVCSQLDIEIDNRIERDSK